MNGGGESSACDHLGQLAIQQSLLGGCMDGGSGDGNSCSISNERPIVAPGVKPGTNLLEGG